MSPQYDGGIDVTWNYKPGFWEQVGQGITSLNNSSVWLSTGILLLLLVLFTVGYRAFGHNLREGNRPEDHGFVARWPNAVAVPLLSLGLVLLLFGGALAVSAANAVEYRSQENFQKTVAQAMAEHGYHVDYWQVPTPQESSSEVQIARSSYGTGTTCTMDRANSGPVHHISVKCDGQIVNLGSGI